jgi:hypothetical protein
MRLHDTTVNQHPPRLVGRRAKGLLTALMLTLWFCDFGTGGSSHSRRTSNLHRAHCP